VKVGDLVVYKKQINHQSIAVNKTRYIVRRIEEKNGWVFLFGICPPVQASLMKVISRSTQHV
jgi:hypothetical protein